MHVTLLQKFHRNLRILFQHKSFYFPGVSYEVGSILPQETGNCLQCICTTDSKVTCNPHNCPPIILPDLFDATGY